MIAEEIIRKEAETLNIVNVRLNDGSEIIGIIHKDKPDEQSMFIEAPLEIIKKSDTRSSYTVSFQEWMPLSENRIVQIFKQTLLSQCSVGLTTKIEYLKHVIDSSAADQIAEEERKKEEEALMYEIPEGLITVH